MWKLLLVVSLLPLLVGCQPREAQTTAAPPAQVAPADTAPPDTAEPASTTAASTAAGWLTSIEEARQQAQAQDKPLLLDFYAEWCGPCKMMDEQTWPDEQVQAALAHYVPVKVDVDKHEALAKEYDVSSIPAIVFVDRSGKEVHRQVGAVEAGRMVELLNQYK